MPRFCEAFQPQFGGLMLLLRLEQIGSGGQLQLKTLFGKLQLGLGRVAVVAGLVELQQRVGARFDLDQGIGGRNRLAGPHQDFDHSRLERLAHNPRFSQGGDHGAVGRQRLLHLLPSQARDADSGTWRTFRRRGSLAGGPGRLLHVCSVPVSHAAGRNHRGEHREHQHRTDPTPRVHRSAPTFWG